MKRRIASLALFVVLWAAPALAQGCIMCSTSAESAGQNARMALHRGVIVLLVPPVGMMAMLVGIAFRYRGHWERTEDDSSGEPPSRP